MEALIRQTRSRFSRKEELEQGRIPIQKTASFRDKRSQNWLRRQLSRQMNLNESGEETEFAAAVAAAAFAVTSIERDESSKNRAEIQEVFYDANAGINETTPEKIVHPVSTVKKTPSSLRKRLTFADELPAHPERAVIKIPSFEDTETMKVPIPPPAVPPLNIEQTPKREIAKDQETDADVWERQEMAKIKERYQKLNATILEWEEKKKKKARRKMEMTESEVEKRRAKATRKYQTEMEEIQQIADGARTKARDKNDKENRYEELYETIREWENERKKKALRKLRMTEVQLENKRVKAKQRYEIEMEQIKEIADGAKAQAKEKLRNEQL